MNTSFDEFEKCFLLKLQNKKLPDFKLMSFSLHENNVLSSVWYMNPITGQIFYLSFDNSGIKLSFNSDTLSIIKYEDVIDLRQLSKEERFQIQTIYSNEEQFIFESYHLITTYFEIYK